MNPRDVFQRAAEILRERGWCQGQYVCDDGSCCLLGAVLTAEDPDAPVDRPWPRWMQDYWDAAVPRGLPATWNDEPGRTADEVIALLERLAA
jgi:hypothetical protein